VLAAAGLIGGFAVALATGSRPLGGAVLALFGVGAVAIWARRHGRRKTAWLTAAGLAAFAVSHALGLLIGAWPAVLLTAAGVAGLYWRVSDSEQRLRQVRDRAHPVRTGGAIPAHEDGLDSRRAGAGDVLLEAVADVDRLS
jgi:hypothetical protein